MRRIFLLIVMSFLLPTVTAQTFVGTMTIGNYTQKNTRVLLKPERNGHYVLIMYDVKFAYLMPVRLNIELSPITVQRGRMQGDGIIPTVKGKLYEKHKVRNFSGTVSSDQLNFSCTMGTKKLLYKGMKR